MTDSLLQAIRSGNAAAVRDAVANSESLNQRFPGAYGAHHYGGATSTLEKDLTPLHLAASLPQAEVTRALLDSGAALDAVTAQQRTALHVAASAGETQQASALLDAGASVNLADANGMTPLHLAAAAGAESIVQRLLAAGAEIDSPAYGVGAVHHAASGALGARKAMDSFRSRGKSNGEAVAYDGDNGRIRYTNSEGTRYLGWDEMLDLCGLEWVCDSIKHYVGAVSSALTLIEAGADTSLTGSRGANANHSFASLGEPLLVEAITDWSARTNTGQKPSHEIVFSKRTDGLAVALSRHPGLALEKDDAGMTPLHFLADKGGPIEMFELLVAHGGDPKAATTELFCGYPAGSTPITIAQKWKDDAAVELLSAAQA